MASHTLSTSENCCKNNLKCKQKEKIMRNFLKEEKDQIHDIIIVANGSNRSRDREPVCGNKTPLSVFFLFSLPVSRDRFIWIFFFVLFIVWSFGTNFPIWKVETLGTGTCLSIDKTKSNFSSFSRREEIKRCK